MSINPIDRHVGAKLRRRRTFEKMSVADAAAAVAVPVKEIALYESGRKRVSAELLFRFCQHYRIAPADIFKGAASTHSSAASSSRTGESSAA